MIPRIEKQRSNIMQQTPCHRRGVKGMGVKQGVAGLRIPFFFIGRLCIVGIALKHQRRLVGVGAERAYGGMLKAFAFHLECSVFSLCFLN